jgi:hypothetical protein
MSGRQWLVWQLRSRLLTCAYPDCTKRAANQRRAILARGTVWAPYVICQGIRHPLCRAHATSDKARGYLLERLLGPWPLPRPNCLPDARFTG